MIIEDEDDSKEYFSGVALDGPIQGQVFVSECQSVRIPMNPHRGPEGYVQFDSVTYRWAQGAWISTVH